MQHCLAEGNREWAQHVPVLLLIVAKTFYDHKGKMGLYVHQMGGYSKELAAKRLVISSGFEPVAMAAVGYYVNAEVLPLALRKCEQQQRTRLPIRPNMKSQ